MDMTQRIFDLLDLEPGDGRTKAGCVVGGMMISVEALLDPHAAGFIESLAQSVIRSMDSAAAEKRLTVNLATVRRYCAVVYAWVPGAGVDDDGHPRRELLPIRHSIHGAPRFGADAAAADAVPTMVQIFWQAETQ